MTQLRTPHTKELRHLAVGLCAQFRHTVAPRTLVSQTLAALCGKRESFSRVIRWLYYYRGALHSYFEIQTIMRDVL